MDLLEQMVRHMECCGLGRADREIFRGRMPDNPEGCLAVFASGGAGPGEAEGARLTILCRSPVPGRAFGMACAAAGALRDWRGFLAGDGLMADIRLEDGAEDMGEDGRKRALYAVRIRVRFGAEE